MKFVQSHYASPWKGVILKEWEKKSTFCDKVLAKTPYVLCLVVPLIDGKGNPIKKRKFHTLNRQWLTFIENPGIEVNPDWLKFDESIDITTTEGWNHYQEKVGSKQRKKREALKKKQRMYKSSMVEVRNKIEVEFHKKDVKKIFDKYLNKKK